MAMDASYYTNPDGSIDWDKFFQYADWMSNQGTAQPGTGNVPPMGATQPVTTPQAPTWGVASDQGAEQETTGQPSEGTPVANAGTAAKMAAQGVPTTTYAAPQPPAGMPLGGGFTAPPSGQPMPNQAAAITANMGIGAGTQNPAAPATTQQGATQTVPQEPSVSGADNLYGLSPLDVSKYVVDQNAQRWMRPDGTLDYDAFFQFADEVGADPTIMQNAASAMIDAQQQQKEGAQVETGMDQYTYNAPESPYAEKMGRVYTNVIDTLLGEGEIPTMAPIMAGLDQRYERERQQLLEQQMIRGVANSTIGENQMADLAMRQNAEQATIQTQLLQQHIQTQMAPMAQLFAQDQQTKQQALNEFFQFVDRDVEMGRYSDQQAMQVMNMMLNALGYTTTPYQMGSYQVPTTQGAGTDIGSALWTIGTAPLYNPEVQSWEDYKNWWGF